MSSAPGQDSENPMLPLSPSLHLSLSLFVCVCLAVYVCVCLAGWHGPYCTQKAHTDYYFKQTWGGQANLCTAATFIITLTSRATNQVLSPKREANTDSLRCPHFRRYISPPRNPGKLFSLDLKWVEVTAQLLPNKSCSHICPYFQNPKLFITLL